MALVCWDDPAPLRQLQDRVRCSAGLGPKNNDAETGVAQNNVSKPDVDSVEQKNVANPDGDSVEQKDVSKPDVVSAESKSIEPESGAGAGVKK